MKQKERILVLGVGNEILTDDGIGPRLVDEMKSFLGSDYYDFEKINLGGLEVLEFIKDYREVIIFDAIKTKDGRPGEVYLLTPDDFTETCHLSNFHDVSFLTALKLGEKLDMQLPEIIIIIAVEIVEDTVFGSSLSPRLVEKYNGIIKEVKTILHILEDNNRDFNKLLNLINHYEEY